MRPSDFRFTSPAAAEQLARILEAAIQRARREKRRGGQHSAPSLDEGAHE